MFKKTFVMCISAIMIFLVGGCTDNVPLSGSDTSLYSNDIILSNGEGSTAESGLNEPSTDLSLSDSSSNKSPDKNSDPNTNDQDEPQTESDILIAYFSWSGHTKQLAYEIQTLTGGDIFEIIPATPYTDEIDELSGIASREQRDNVRPPLASHVDDIGKYDIVFVGYPNWWNNMPMPVFSFLEEYDFSGKTVIPFTSYGNGIFGKSIDSLEETLPDSILEDGLAVQEHDFDDMPQKVSDWLGEIEILK